MRCTQCDGRCTIARTLGIDGHTVQSECPTCMGMGTLPEENGDESVKTESYLERSFLDEPQPLAPKGRPTFAGPDAENPNKRPPHLVPRDGTTILEVVARMPVMSEKGRDHKVHVQVVVPGDGRMAGQSSPFDTVVSSLACEVAELDILLLTLSDTIYHMAKENNLLVDIEQKEKEKHLGAGFDLGSSVFPDDLVNQEVAGEEILEGLASMLGVTDPTIKQATCPVCIGTGLEILAKTTDGSMVACASCNGAGTRVVSDKPTAPMSDNPRTPEEGAPPVPPVGT